jgi:hypothetical protein
LYTKGPEGKAYATKVILNYIGHAYTIVSSTGIEGRFPAQASEMPKSLTERRASITAYWRKKHAALLHVEKTLITQ